MNFLQFAIVALVGILIVAWPYLLGTYIAVAMGAHDPSTTRFVVGWIFETIYIAAIVAVAVYANEKKRGSLANWVVGAVVVSTTVGGIWLALNPIVPTPAEVAATKPCPAQSLLPGQGRIVKMPDVIGQNAFPAKYAIMNAGFKQVEYESANSKYKSIWEPKNWTVASTDPRPGCEVADSYSVTIYAWKD